MWGYGWGERANILTVVVLGPGLRKVKNDGNDNFLKEEAYLNVGN